MECNNNRPEAWTASYEASRRRWLRYLQFITGCGAAAEDVLHDSWLEVLSEVRPGGEVEVEKVGIVAMRHAHRARRRARRERPASAQIESTAWPQTSTGTRNDGVRSDARGDAAATAIRHDCLHDAIQRLDGSDREILVKRYFYKKPTVLIAREAGISIAAATSRLKRARARLRDEVEQRLGQVHGALHEHDGRAQMGCAGRRS
jgi:RNA polymerase sigma factor (sigma-70 family)